MPSAQLRLSSVAAQALLDGGHTEGAWLDAMGYDVLRCDVM